jgi:hypothetical protein
LSEDVKTEETQQQEQEVPQTLTPDQVYHQILENWEGMEIPQMLGQMAVTMVVITNALEVLNTKLDFLLQQAQKADAQDR